MPNRVAGLSRWALYSVLALLLALLSLELISWNFLKKPIEQRFEAATGRTLSIDGPLSLSLLPNPRVSANAVKLGNPGWTEAPSLLEIEHLSIKPSLWAALTGKAVLDSITIEAPQLSLQDRPDGVANWVFPGLKTDTGEAQAGTLPVVVRELSVTDARLRYRSGEQPPLALSLPSVQIDDDGESTALQASISFREKNFQLEARADSYRRLLKRRSEFGGELLLRTAQGRVEASFVFPRAPELTSGHVDWELKLQNLAHWSRWAGRPAIELETLSMGSRVEHKAGRWRFSAIEATLAGSRVTGELELATDETMPLLSGQLHSPDFDAAALLAALPRNGEPIASPAALIPVLPRLSASIGFSIDRLRLDPSPLRELEAELTLEDQLLTLEALEFQAAGGRGVVSAVVAGNKETLALDLKASVKDIDLATLGAPSALSGTFNGELAFDLQSLSRQPAPAMQTIMDRLRIEQARVSYADQTRQTDILATLETAGLPAAPRISVSGDFRGQSLTATLRGDPQSDLAGAPTDYSIEARAKSGAAMLVLETDLASMLQPQAMAATFELSADDVRALQPWVERPLPSLADLRAAGRLERDGRQWNATALKLEAGRSSATGEIGFRNRQRPFLTASLHATRINLMPWAGADTPPEAQAPSADRGAGDSLRAALRGVDANVDLRVDQLDLPADADMHDLLVSGTLEQGQAEIDPLRFNVAGGEVTATLDVGVENQKAFGSLKARLDDIALDRLTETFTGLENRLGRVSGVIDLQVTETLPNALRGDLLFPSIGRIRFSDSRLHFKDAAARTDLTLKLRTRGLDDKNQEFRIDGEGRYDGDPFTLSFRGDELLRVRDPDRPYALELEGEIVASQFALSGTVLRPLALEGLDLQLSLEGPNPERLSRILGIPLPTLPAYSVTGALTLAGKRWLLQNLDGEFGESDLSGQLGLDASTRPPHLSGDLQSDTLRLEDLAGVYGARPDKNETGPGDPGERRVLPQQPFIDDAWRDVTADVRYRGRSLRARDIPVSDMVVNLLLENGSLKVAPLSFGVGDGSVDFNLDLDVSKRPSQGSLEAEVRAVDLQKALQEWDLAEDSIGTVGARGKFWVQGDAIAELFASADGGLVLLMHGGRLDAVLIELAGLDASQVFTSLLRDRNPVPIDCAYVDIKTRDGLATLDTAIFDTADTKFTAGGEIDFAGERLAITVLANPKDISVGALRSPVELSGTFNDINLGISADGLAARLGSAAVLGVLATPIAALLPMLDTGGGEDSAYCQNLMKGSQGPEKKTEDAPQ